MFLLVRTSGVADLVVVIIITTEDIVTLNLEPPKVAAPYWNEIGDFSLAAVEEAGPAIPYRQGELLRAATGLTLWAWQTSGLPLERDVIFRRHTIERFVAEGLAHYTNSGRTTRRSQLLRMAEFLLGPKVMPPRMRPIGLPEALAPYTHEQLASFRSLAATQSPRHRLVNAEVLLSLGFGAGLAAREITNLRVGDIRVDNEGVLVDVTGDRPRTVPLLAEWEPAIIELVQRARPVDWAFLPGRTKAYKNVVTNFVYWSGTEEETPQTPRMRSTWVVHQLSRGVHVVPLLQAAGVKSLEAIARYVKYVPGIDPDQARAILRGGD